jgi:arsenate reductase
MAEAGIDISAHRSKSADEFRGTPLDLVITVCDNAAQNCPLWLGKERVVHISFPDPSKVAGSDDERLAAFRRTRDAMQRTICAYLENENEEETHAPRPL